MGEEEWVAAAPECQVLVEELRSWVDAASESFAVTCDRRVVVAVLQLSQGADEAVGGCVLAPSSIRVQRPEVNL